MAWLAGSPAQRRAQFGPLLLGTGGIGGIALKTGPGIGLSESDGLRLIDRAVTEEGVTVLDTADAYAGGASEKVVGHWTRLHPDSTVLIQSKTGLTPDGPDLTPDRITEQLHRSIQTIGRVDLYLAHRVDPRTPWSESLRSFSAAVVDGRIRAYGLSNVDGPQLAQALETADRLGLVRPEIVQNSYSLLMRRDEAEVLPIVASEGLAYTPFSPLATGLLAGRYSRGEQPSPNSRAANGPIAGGLLANRGLIERLREFDELASAHSLSPAGLAVAWLRSRPEVTSVVAGISRDRHWAGYHEAAAFSWASSLTEQLDEIFPPTE